MRITDFILARVAEDERAAREWYGTGTVANRRDDFWLAECEAKRRIVERGTSECGGYAQQAEFGGHHYPDPEWAFCDGCSAASASDADWRGTLQIIAAIWADHPDYDEAWR